MSQTGSPRSPPPPDVSSLLVLCSRIFAQKSVDSLTYRIPLIVYWLSAEEGDSLLDSLISLIELLAVNSDSDL